jgi:hypothetical protein
VNYLKGLVVRLKTGSARFAGTDDSLFLGVAGVAGGREFPLDVRWFDDAERVSDVRYALGEVWDEAALVGALRPKLSDRDWNDPSLFYVGFDGIDRVYLRKQAAGRSDDAYQLDAIEVELFGSEPSRRVFRSGTAIWLGLEYGMQVWIPERGGD